MCKHRRGLGASSQKARSHGHSWRKTVTLFHHWLTGRPPTHTGLRLTLLFFGQCSWAYTQNIYPTRELQHRPMGATGGTEQLQTNVVTVNPECSLSNIQNTSSPRLKKQVQYCPVLRPKQKQNRKHDDTGKNTLTLEATWLRGTYTVDTAVLLQQYEMQYFSVCFTHKTRGTLEE